MREIFMYGSVGRAPGDRCLYPELGNSMTLHTNLLTEEMPALPRLVYA